MGGRGSGSPQPVAIGVVTGAPKMAPGGQNLRFLIIFNYFQYIFNSFLIHFNMEL